MKYIAIALYMSIVTLWVVYLLSPNTQLVCYHKVDWVQKTTVMSNNNLSLSMNWLSYCYLENEDDALYDINKRIVDTYWDNGIYTFNKL